MDEIEVTGRSKESFDAAIADAVWRAVGEDDRMHYFEIVEQKGVVLDCQVTEYHVRMKARLEDHEGGDHVCPTCHSSTGASGHLCVPTKVDDLKCDFCGSLIPDERHLCDDKVKELAYVCNTCGRTAISAEHLCDPKKIECAGGGARWRYPPPERPGRGEHPPPARVRGGWGIMGPTRRESSPNRRFRPIPPAF